MACQGIAEYCFYQRENASANSVSIWNGGGDGPPGNTEISLALPVGDTISTFLHNGDTGFAIGDLRVGVTALVKEAPNGGVGMSLGVFGFIPTGQNARLMGEGNFSLLPFWAMSFTSFSSSITANIGYRLRPSHQIVLLDDSPLEQDDELIWRVALRIPKDEDIAWSLVANGQVGVATDEGLWPSAKSRTAWVGGGIDYPSIRDYRLSLFCSFLVSGEDFGGLFSVQLGGVPKDKDEDRDGISLRDDECPLLREDKDNFEDEDGCPDYDNDMDTFPDTEDACPLQAADEFSDDGC